MDLVRFLNIEQTIPSRDAGATRTNESVGTVTIGTLNYDLDHAYIIANSYTIYANNVALIENTDYTLDKDSGIITLLSGKDTEFDGQDLTAEYSFCSLQIIDSELQEVLDSAQTEIDHRTSTHFAVGTDTTPDYIQVTNEEQKGKGSYDRDYYLKKYPLPDVSTTLDGDVAIGATTITVVSTQGFPDSGTLTIGTEKVVYSSKTSTTFTVTALTAAHDDGDAVYSYVIEISTSEAGVTPVWQVLSVGDQVYVDLDSGLVHVYEDNIILDSFIFSSPPRIPNRFRSNYIYGYETIPNDIKRLTLQIASKELMHRTGNRQLIDGRTIERIEQFEINDEWIDRQLNKYKSWTMNNT